MYTTSENTTTVIIALIALGILGWGYYRARPYGKVGILGWLQSVVLMTPWLVFFALFAAGIYLNLILILFLLVACTGLYIYLGWKLRIIAAQETENKTDIEAISNSLQKSSSEEKTKLANGEEKREETLEFIPIPTEELKKAKVA